MEQSVDGIRKWITIDNLAVGENALGVVAAGGWNSIGLVAVSFMNAMGLVSIGPINAMGFVAIGGVNAGCGSNRRSECGGRGRHWRLQRHRRPGHRRRSQQKCIAPPVGGVWTRVGGSRKAGPIHLDGRGHAEAISDFAFAGICPGASTLGAPTCPQDVDQRNGRLRGISACTLASRAHAPQLSESQGNASDGAMTRSAKTVR